MSSMTFVLSGLAVLCSGLVWMWCRCYLVHANAPMTMVEHKRQAWGGARGGGKSPYNPCDICSGRSEYVCAKCREPLKNHSHENDYICKVHGFVNAIRLSDGAEMGGDGELGPPYVIRMGDGSVRD